jgi:dihydrofolate synthase/folylpolyglutamate synthase
MLAHISDINSSARYGRLTTFEVLTAIGFVYFHRKRVDFQVIEAGLGGRLDATNVLRPLVAVITTIGLDHMAVLGSTLGQIAAEKAGIIKADSTVVCATQPPEAREVIEQVCAQTGACLVDTEKAIALVHQGFMDGYQLFEVTGQLAIYHVELPLLGSYQSTNLACAVAAVEELNGKGFKISQTKIEKGLTRSVWRGRFQVMMERPLVIADGAHNPEAIKTLLFSLDTFLSKTHYRPERFTLVFGSSRDKNVPDMVNQLSGFFDEIIVTRSAHPRAMDAEKIAAEFSRYNKSAKVAIDVSRAVKKALDITPDSGLILITGSLFVVGDALNCLDHGLKG